MRSSFTFFILLRRIASYIFFILAYVRKNTLAGGQNEGRIYFTPWVQNNSAQFEEVTFSSAPLSSNVLLERLLTYYFKGDSSGLRPVSPCRRYCGSLHRLI